MQNGGTSLSSPMKEETAVSAIANGNGAEAGPSKKLKLDFDDLRINVHENEIRKFVDTLHRRWSTGDAYSGEQANLSDDPFMHVEIRDFIADEVFLKGLVRKLAGVQLVEKSSDLFKFRQSQDLISVSVPEIQSLREFFETKVLDFMKQVTGLPLDGKVDMFISEYIRTDFLLCHDDELESRRIAFIFYLSEDWDNAYGGSLDLFSSSDEIHPLSIVKSIIPAFNKFVFFNVTSKSFHQVAEVTSQSARRLAVSGWFYGDALPRPTVTFPSEEFHLLHGNLLPKNQNLADNFTTEYLNALNYSAINTSLEEYSIAKLKLLIQPEKYKDLVELVEDQRLEWEQRGPANLCSYKTTKRHIFPINNTEGTFNIIQSLQSIFCSKPFYEFLQSVTEFDILAPTTQVTASLRKFQHKSYILLRTTEGKEPQVSDPTESSDEGETWEIAPDEDGSDDDNEGDTIESSESQEQSSSSVAIEEDLEKSDEEEEDSEDLEREIDIIYYFGEFIWKEDFGGQTVYVDATGQQLLTITPEANTMAIVVREKGIVPYVSYINCLAGNEQFHAVSLTLTGFKD